MLLQTLIVPKQKIKANPKNRNTMKKRAIIYTRVASTEQDSESSKNYQSEALSRYCGKNKIEVLKSFHDVGSGSISSRPEWNNLIEFLGSNKNEANSLYIISFDRILAIL